MPPRECTPRTRVCSDDARTARSCSDQGRWVEESCGPTRECGAGLCLCKAGSCDEGEFHATIGDLTRLAPGRDFLFYTGKKVARIDLRTRGVASLGSGDLDDVATGGIVADGSDNVYWCQTNEVTRVELLMKNGEEILDKVFCQELRLVGTQLFGRTTGTVFRRSLARPGVDLFIQEPLTAFDVTSSHLYTAGRARVFSVLERVSLIEPTKVEKITELMGDVFDRLAADETHVFIAAGQRLLRVPAMAGATVQDTLWQEASTVVTALALTPTHVYWSASSLGDPGSSSGDRCLRARAFRVAKTGGPVTLLSDVPGLCAIDLVAHEDSLYLGLASNSVGEGPSKIHRLRR